MGSRARPKPRAAADSPRPQPALRRDEISGLRRRLEELGYLIFHYLVGHGHARLAKFEFERGMDEVGLDHLPAFVRVLEYMPGIGAVAPALEADILHRGEEGDAVLRIHHIFGDCEDRTLIIWDAIEEG